MSFIKIEEIRLCRRRVVTEAAAVAVSRKTLSRPRWRAPRPETKSCVGLGKEFGGGREKWVYHGPCQSRVGSGRYRIRGNVVYPRTMYSVQRAGVIYRVVIRKWRLPVVHTVTVQTSQLPQTVFGLDPRHMCRPN